MLKSVTILGGGVIAAMLLLSQHASAQPAGSYMGSCRRIHQDGPRLFAVCKDMDGNWRRAEIDLRYCGGPIANTNGRLTCPPGHPRMDQGRPDHHDEDHYRMMNRDRSYGDGDQPYGDGDQMMNRDRMYGRPPY